MTDELNNIPPCGDDRRTDHAFDRAVRRARLRRTVPEAAVVAGVAAFVSGLIGLAVAGVDGMLKGAAGGLLAVSLPTGIVVTYRLYTYRDDEWW